MSNISQTSMPSVTILLGAQKSSSMNFQRDFFDAEVISIQAPAAVDAAEYTLEASDDDITYGPLQDINRAAIKAPNTASATIVYNGIAIACNYLRIASASNVAADRVFLIKKAWRGF